MGSYKSKKYYNEYQIKLLYSNPYRESFHAQTLTLLGWAFQEFILEWGGGKITSCLKLVRITLETSNLVKTNTRICSFSTSIQKYTFQYQYLLNFADVSIFLGKISVFGKISTFTQSNSIRAVFEIFQFCFYLTETKGQL